MRAKPAKGSAKRSMVEWLAEGGSMFLTAAVGDALFGAAIGENTRR
jgi:hypothetical protein